jgi:hypothetical protein
MFKRISERASRKSKGDNNEEERKDESVEGSIKKKECEKFIKEVER